MPCVRSPDKAPAGASLENVIAFEGLLEEHDPEATGKMLDEVGWRWRMTIAEFTSPRALLLYRLRRTKAVAAKKTCTSLFNNSDVGK